MVFDRRPSAQEKQGPPISQVKSQPMATHHLGLWGGLVLAVVLASAMPGNSPAYTSCRSIDGVACVSLLLSCLLFSFFEHTASLKVRGAKDIAVAFDCTSDLPFCQLHIIHRLGSVYATIQNVRMYYCPPFRRRSDLVNNQRHTLLCETSL